MKKTLLSVSLVAALAFASVTAGAPKRAAVNRAAIPPASARTAPQPTDDDVAPIARGACSVLVRHAWTGEPLAGLPVTLERGPSGSSDQITVRLVAYTGIDGLAEFKQLNQGEYRAYVRYNGMMSEVSRIEIKAGAHAYVTLTFNPDID